MGCAGCGFEAPAGFSFCPKCGTRLACTACGAPAAPDFVFCARCGRRLDEAAPAVATQPAAEQHETPYADRRPVTVLFADLAGFTALGERLDPEDVRALQNELYEVLRAALTRFGGFMEKFVGDAAMGVFGAPVAHEDDPERALRAALDMHARVAELGARWAGRLDRPLALHVGVNTGRVVAGRLGAEQGTYAVTGDTVNTAARLQSAAVPGETLVSDATRLLTGHAFAFESRGSLALKGKAEPLPVYRLLGVEEKPRSARGLEAHGLKTPFVGRENELERMAAAFDLALSGHSQVVSLVGEAGTGKSRLIDEFLQRIGGQSQALAIRRVACSSLGEQPYGVIATCIRQGYGVLPADALEVAQRKIGNGLRALGVAQPEAAGMMPMVGYVLGLQSTERAPDAEPDRVSRQILLLVRTALQQRLDHGPLLLVVEDLHWADTASIQAMRRLADWFADRQLLLLCSHRPDFDGRALATTHAAQTTLRLPPLADAHIDGMLESLFRPGVAGCLPESLHRLVVQRAGGNPFYLEEILRGLIAEGVLVDGPGGWRCGGEAGLAEVPPTIEALLLSRVDRLPAPLRRCLHESAVLGPSFDAALLRAVADSHVDASVLEALCQAGLIEEIREPATQESGYRFSHALVHEVVYRNLLVSRRTDLHGRAGRALERRHGTRPDRLEDLALLGRHFSLGDDRRRGAGYLVAAADWARSIYANDDAVRHYEHALRVLRECDAGAAETSGIREHIGDLLAPLGRAGEALAHYQAVQDAATDDVTKARMHRKIGGLHWDAGERGRGLACLEAGLALLEHRVEDIELAYLYQEMGRLAFRSGDNEAAVGWAQRALAQAERADVRAGADAGAHRKAANAVAHALNTLGSALARLGRAEAAVQHIERSVAVALAEGSLQAACRSYANLGVLYATLNPGKAVETCLTGLETARRIGDLGFQSRLYANLAVAYCALTNRCDDDGLRAAQAAIDLERRLGQRDHLAVPLIVLGQIHQCHGELDTALRYYGDALAVAEESDEPQLLFPCYDGIATVQLDRGDLAEAERYLEKAQRVCDRAGVDRDSLVVLPFLC